MTVSKFHYTVIGIVSNIPRGRVMTYGQIAALAGNARAGRIVGGIAHYGDPALPWQRVVNRHGGLATGYPGGREAHCRALEAEGIQCVRQGEMYVVELDKYIWKP